MRTTNLPYISELLGLTPASQLAEESAARRKAPAQNGAGLGCWGTTRATVDRRAIIEWKKELPIDAGAASPYADALVSLIREWSPYLSGSVFVPIPPQGASYPGEYAAAR